VVCGLLSSTMKYVSTVLLVVVISLYTKSVIAKTPPPELPCQKYSILGKQHSLCWTVDDHPNKGTLAMLSVLKKNKIKATFFIVSWALKQYDKYPNNKNTKKLYGWFKAIQNDGHLLGNHTVTHSNLCKISKRQARWELGLTQKYIMKYGKVRPTLWRPPSLVTCGQAYRAARRYGLTVVMSDVGDYRRSSAFMWKKLARRVRRGKTTSIILLHRESKKFQRFLRLIKQHP